MAKTNGDKPTYKDIYNLVDETRKELSSSITRLEAKFDQLEAGRLSKLETNMAELQGKIVATTALIAFIISTGIAVASGFLRR